MAAIEKHGQARSAKSKCPRFQGNPGEGKPTLVLVLVVAGAVVWWRVGYARWGLVTRVVFWLVVVAVLWVLVNYYSMPQPGG
jgi:fatty acid desaturase